MGGCGYVFSGSVGVWVYMCGTVGVDGSGTAVGMGGSGTAVGMGG